MGHKINEMGNVYGRLTVIGEASKRGSETGSFWNCRCHCGSRVVVCGTQLRAGASKSCGCRRNDRNKETKTTHGLSKHPLRNSWRHMMCRCYDKEHKNYNAYGGRGIEVCKEWCNLKSFVEWIEDNLGPRPKDYSMDRMNNDGNYEPGNVRWASAKTQALNRRRKRG